MTVCSNNNKDDTRHTTTRPRKKTTRRDESPNGALRGVAPLSNRDDALATADGRPAATGGGGHRAFARFSGSTLECRDEAAKVDRQATAIGTSLTRSL